MVSSSKQSARVNGYLKIPEDLMYKIKQVQLKRLQDFPDDFGSLLYLYRLARLDALPESAKNNLNTFATFSENLRNSTLGKQLYVEQTNLINNKIATGAGKEVPLFKVNDINNSLFTNSSLKGQPYMIVFSATWCGPCQKQLPKLKKLYQSYSKNGLKVIYFNDDNNVVRWKEHVLKNNLTWINVSERLKPSVSKIPKSFGVYSIPTCLVVNKNGIIIYNSDETDPSIEKLESFIILAVDGSHDDAKN
jgi:thiol-disulfide isomerase/thioredoxin